MHYVYLLKSIKTTNIYIGYTSDLDKRIKEHAEGKTYTTLKVLGKSAGWQEEEKRLYRLFMDTYGSAPKCNRVRP